MANSYSVSHMAYCGMRIPLAEGLSYKEARERVKRRIAWFKEVFGGPVTFISPLRYELEEPEDCMMVPDSCGYLTINKE